MKHLLMDPRFPDIVGEWAEEEAREEALRRGANDNGDLSELSDPLFWLTARAELAATRAW